LNTWYQRSRLKGGTLTPAGTEYHTSIAMMPLATPMNMKAARHPKVLPMSTDSGLPTTEPTDQPTINLPSVGARSSSDVSMLIVAATCGV
jgi:hypothetical protein